ncbi:MAG TPA: alpha/beta fold hydrolase, partial [Candidatus Polarisedimenticolaceae bacterium]|nr:alpha/beta fold hydrolase [Candidatus Polarisedimenticolaceae bacterium]
MDTERSTALARYTGRYDLADGGDVVVDYVADGQIVLTDLDRDARSIDRFADFLERDEGDRFAWRAGEARPDATVTFRRDEHDRVTGLDWSAGGRSGRADRSDGFAIREIRWRANDITITASLYQPVRPIGGVVMIHGSPPSSRDLVWYQTFAQPLADRGIAVLLPDRRGSGLTSGDGFGATFDELAADTLSAVETLRSLGLADRGGVGLLGLSQGAWVAPLCASRDTRIAFVAHLSGSMTTPAEQVTHEIRQGLRRNGFTPEDQDRILALNDLLLAAVAGRSAWREFAEARERLLRTDLAPAVEPFPGREDDPRTRFWRAGHDFDPVPLLARIRVPLLFVYGKDDELDNVPVRRSVERLESWRATHGRADVSVRLFDGLGHSLCPSDDSGWVAPEVLRTITDWVTETLRAPPNGARP